MPSGSAPTLRWRAVQTEECRTETLGRSTRIVHDAKTKSPEPVGAFFLRSGGGGRNRTGVHGFAGRCMTTLPPGHCARIVTRKSRSYPLKKTKPREAEVLQETGAGNETRTRDPDLGKVVLYQLSYSRIGVRNSNRTVAFVKSPGRFFSTNVKAAGGARSRLGSCRPRLSRSRRMHRPILVVWLLGNSPFVRERLVSTALCPILAGSRKTQPFTRSAA